MVFYKIRFFFKNITHSALSFLICMGVSILAFLTGISLANAQDSIPPAAPSASTALPAVTSSSAPASPSSAATTSANATPYTVVDGYKVDAETMKGFRAWRSGACDRCHGANQEGMVGPSLINSLKTLSKDDFIKTIRDGRLEKGMVSFGTNKPVMDNINGLYAYLKGRSDGAITRAKVEAMP